MTSSKSPFTRQDDSAFVKFVSEHLKKGAAKIRRTTEEEYVGLARRRWSICEPDQVYAIKLLVDPLTQPELASGVTDKLVSLGEPFCLLIARIDENGALVDAPEGYHPPSHPKIALGHIPVGSPSSGVVPDAGAPTDYLVAYFDVLGFEAMLEDLGLELLYRKYERLLSVALLPHSESRPWSKALTLIRGQIVPGLMWLPIQTTYFSDSLLLWVHYRPGHVAEFLQRCSQVFCRSLELGIPLRGAISVGRAVMDKSMGTYLGQPLVEAVRLEGKSDWVGVTLGESWKSAELRIPIPPDKVLIYDPPLKDGDHAPNAGLVLDWPRVWRDSLDGDAAENLSRLRDGVATQTTRSKYDAAIEFVTFSRENANWDIPPGGSRITSHR